MYRQILVHEDDRDLQRIRWVQDDQCNEVSYRLNTVTYGTKSAPFLAVQVLLQLAEDEEDKYPLAVPSITMGRYVDDIFGGAVTLTQLIDIALQLKELCSAGGFPLAKWFSTHQEILTAVDSSSNNTTIAFDDCSTKLLGLKWLTTDDILTFSSHQSEPDSSITKRRILSEVAQIFDPLGLVAPIVIRAKILLQELWLHKLNWDEPLSSQLVSRWLIIRKELKNLARLSVPRWFNTWSNSIVEIHGFSDASQLAMAAVIYITVTHPSSTTTTSLVCAKTKVAPLKRLTIPRLELAAALLVSTLAKYVQATLKVNVRTTHLWTDSQVTLAWIKSHPSRWKEFVRNRVLTIQELMPNALWRHVPGTSNPADCASRGLSTSQLETHPLWWKGPQWLTQPEDKRPTQDFKERLAEDQCKVEARPVISLMSTINQPDYHWNLIYKYSSLNKLLRITSWVTRSISKWRKMPDAHSTPTISANEIKNALQFWTISTQSVFFSSELKLLQRRISLGTSHSLTKLTAFIDGEGIIRVGGRLSLSSLPYEQRHPAILPQHCQLSKLIVNDAHLKTLHGGTQLTLAHVRNAFWIIGGRSVVKSYIVKCVVCARQRGIRAHQLMGQLPLCRVTPSRPFSHTGIDYAGPLNIKS